MPLDPQARTVLDTLAAMGLPPVGSVSAVESRIAMATRPLPPGAEVASVENRRVVGPDGDIPVRIYTPIGQAPLPVLVWFHGGGWVLGSLDASDHTCRELANTAGCLVVSVDYRLAPEHKFPAGLRDCDFVFQWALANAASLGGDPTRVAVGGDSAGGNLSTAVCLSARSRGGPAPIFQVLIYPVIDHDFDRPSYCENAEGYMLTAHSMRWFWEQYVHSPAEMADPLASPIHASDLSGLPPALIITAEFDPLRDEGEAYADRLRQAGVPVVLSRYDGMIHGFFGMFPAIDKGKLAVGQASEALKSAFNKVQVAV
jgi:acetyl esterase